MILSAYNFQRLKKDAHSVSFGLENSKEIFKVFVLDENIIRVMNYKDKPILDKTWMIAPGMEDIPLEGRERMDISPFSCPDFTVVEEETRVIIETTRIKLVIHLDGMKMEWFAKKEGKEELFLQDRKTQAYNLDGAFGRGVYHYIQRTKNESYYGLGERAGHVDKYGSRFKMENVDPMGYDAEFTDPLYKHVPFYITRNHEKKIAYGIFYDNLATSHFDMGKELDNYHGAYRYYYAEAGDLDYYVILGPEVEKVTKTFSWMTGKTIFPPKWSLGYSGSTMHYTDAPNAQEQLQQFVEDCKTYDIPCQSFQLSSGYTSIGDKRYVFNWNTDKIPDAKKMSKGFHDAGLSLCANIKPALLIDHPMYKDLEQQGLFIKDATGQKTETAMFWDEIGAYVDFTNPEAFQWWKNQVTQQLLKKGIDSTWNDNNEYEIWDGQAKTFGFGQELAVELIKPLFSLLMMKASFEAQTEFNGDIRPYLISRSGCPGMQRYVQTWSGDNRTDYKTIRFNSKMGIGLSLSGIYNIGHDVGGFAGDAPEPELFIRWIQNGIFHPRFTIHSWNDDATVNEPWMYKEYLEPIRDLMIFRMQLVPYLYDLLYKAHANYEPIIRPTFLNYETDEKTFEENDEFMVGKDILVASVFNKGQTTRKLYLPKDANGWYEYYSGKWYAGGQEIEVEAPLEKAVFFLRAGSILPLNTAVQGFETKEKEARTYRIFPLQEDGEFEVSFYEDDGKTMDYKNGVHALVTLKVICTKDTVTVTRRVEGPYELPYKEVAYELGTKDKRILVIN